MKWKILTRHYVNTCVTFGGLLAPFFLVATPHSTDGATRQWTGNTAAPKAFNNPLNWNPNFVPTGTDFALFDINDTVTFTATTGTGEVNVAGAAVVANESTADTIWNIGGAGGGFRVESNASLTLNGLDLWTPGINVRGTSTLTINSGSEVRVQMTASTPPVAGNPTSGLLGTYVVNAGGTLTSQFLVLGSDSFFGPFTSGRMIVNGGVASFGSSVLMADVEYHASQASITISGGGVVQQQTGSLSVAANTGVGSAATLNISGSGSTYRLRGSASAIVGSEIGTGRVFISDSGLLDIDGGALGINRFGTVSVNGGSITAGGPIIVSGGRLTLGSGTITVASGNDLRVVNDGAFIVATSYAVSPDSFLHISNGIGSFTGGLHVGVGNTATMTVGASGSINTGALSTWGSGLLGKANVTLNGIENLPAGLAVGVNGGAATVNLNGGTCNIAGAAGLSIGDAVGTAAAKFTVTGASSRIQMDNFSPVTINQRGTLALVAGGVLNATTLTIDGGTFDGVAGSYTIAAFSPFSAAVAVKNNGVFKGNNLTLIPGFMDVTAGGSLSLTGALVRSRGTSTVSGANSGIQAATAFIERGSMTITSGATANFGSLSVPFNPFGAATLTVSNGAALHVTGAMDIGANNRMFLRSGSGSVAVASVSVGGPLTNNATFAIDSSNATGVTASFGDVGGVGQFHSNGVATVTFNHLRQSALILQGETILKTRPNGGPTGTSRVGVLDFGSAESDTHWDLADNDLILDSTPASYIRALLLIGRNGGAWNGGGISSSAAALDQRMALGYADNASLNYVTFGGQTVSASSTLVGFTLAGDANLDGTVNIADFSRLAANFNLTSVWISGDFNYSGTTEIGDFAVLAANFNRSMATGLPRESDVPEPFAGSLLAFLAFGADAIQRRRCMRR